MPPEGKAPLLIEDLKRIVRILPGNLAGLRNKAILLLGSAGGYRRSEIVGLNVEDLDFRANGLIITLRRSKTDQEGKGYKKGIPYGKQVRTCPVRALKAWLEQAHIHSGPVFRPIDRFGRVSEKRLSSRSVANIVKKGAKLAGLNPDIYSGHSLRAGFATQAAINKASDLSIMRQGGWRSFETVQRYIRDGNLFRDNAADYLGL